jgi:hypothetical protein
MARVKKFMKRELITSNLGCFFIFIQFSLEFTNLISIVVKGKKRGGKGVTNGERKIVLRLPDDTFQA